MIHPAPRDDARRDHDRLPARRRRGRGVPPPRGRARASTGSRSTATARRTTPSSCSRTGRAASARRRRGIRGGARRGLRGSRPPGRRRRRGRDGRARDRRRRRPRRRRRRRRSRAGSRPRRSSRRPPSATTRTGAACSMAAGSAPHGDGFARLETDRLTVAFDGVAVFADGSPTGAVPELAGAVCRIDLRLGPRRRRRRLPGLRPHLRLRADQCGVHDVSRIVLKLGGRIAAAGAARGARPAGGRATTSSSSTAPGRRSRPRWSGGGSCPTFVEGRRVTTTEVLDVVRASLAEVNATVCAAIGPLAVPLFGDAIGLQATQVEALGLVGDPTPVGAGRGRGGSRGRPDPGGRAAGAEGGRSTSTPTRRQPLSRWARRRADRLRQRRSRRADGRRRDRADRRRRCRPDARRRHVRGRDRAQARGGRPRARAAACGPRSAPRRWSRDGASWLRATSVVSVARRGAADVRARGRHDRARRRVPRVGRHRARVPRLRRRNRRRRPRPLRAGAARRRARAARPPLARVEPLLDGADAAARRAARRNVSPAGRAFFCNSGAEANEAALKIARKATGRTRIVALEGGFHGRTLGALSATGQPVEVGGLRPARPRDRVRAARTTSSRSRPRSHPAADTALILLEPVLGEGGVIPLEPAFAQAAAELALEVGALLVRRRGAGGHGPHGNVLRARAARHPARPRDARQGPRKWAAHWRAARRRAGGARASSPGDHGSTFGGNPVAAAAAGAVVEAIDDELLGERA